MIDLDKIGGWLSLTDGCLQMDPKPGGRCFHSRTLSNGEAPCWLFTQNFPWKPTKVTWKKWGHSALASQVYSRGWFFQVLGSMTCAPRTSTKVRWLREKDRRLRIHKDSRPLQRFRAEKLWSAVLAFNLLPMYMIGYLNVNLAFLRHTNSTLPPPTRPVLCRRRWREVDEQPTLGKDSDDHGQSLSLIKQYVSPRPLQIQ